VTGGRPGRGGGRSGQDGQDGCTRGGGRRNTARLPTRRRRHREPRHGAGPRCCLHARLSHKAPPDGRCGRRTPESARSSGAVPFAGASRAICGTPAHAKPFVRQPHARATAGTSAPGVARPGTLQREHFHAGVSVAERQREAREEATTYARRDDVEVGPKVGALRRIGSATVAPSTPTAVACVAVQDVQEMRPNWLAG
jgi:hypothetical protein